MSLVSESEEWMDDVSRLPFSSSFYLTSFFHFSSLVPCTSFFSSSSQPLPFSRTGPSAALECRCVESERRGRTRGRRAVQCKKEREQRETLQVKEVRGRCPEPSVLSPFLLDCLAFCSFTLFCSALCSCSQSSLPLLHAYSMHGCSQEEG